MKKNDALTQLDGFLAEYTDEIHALFYEVMAVVDRQLVGAARMVYCNYNAQTRDRPPRSGDRAADSRSEVGNR